MVVEKIRAWICNALNCTKEVTEDYNKRIQGLQFKLADAEKRYVDMLYDDAADKTKIANLEGEMINLTNQINAFKAQLASIPKQDIPSPFEKYYNEKIPSLVIHYSGRYDYRTEKQLSVDIRTFFQNPQYDQDLKDICSGPIGITSDDSNDTKIWKIQKYVVQNLSYNFDSFTSKRDEYWQLPYETLTTKKGDCEDGAIFMANLALAVGVPYWRVRINAGDVEYQGATAGHAWMVYCRESDNKFCIVDWCYFPDLDIPVEKKPYWKDVSWYKTLWFSFHQRSAYSDVSAQVYDQDEFNKFTAKPVV